MGAMENNGKDSTQSGVTCELNAPTWIRTHKGGSLGLYMIDAHIWVKIGECMLFGIDGFIIYQNHKKSFWN